MRVRRSFSAVSKPNFARKYALESSRRDLHVRSSAASDVYKRQVQVCCRVRPERNDASVVDLRCAGREVQLHKIEGVCEEAVYTFDKVFSPTSPQREVYEQSARPVIEAILQGFNAKKRLTLS